MAHRRARKASVSWIVLLGAGLAAVAAGMLLAAPLGYRLGLLPLRTALLTVLRWGAYGAAAAAVVSAAGLALQLRRPRRARRGVALAAVTLVVSAAMFAVPARFRLGGPKPVIHDVTTDTVDPPQFVAVVPLNSPGRTDYAGEAVAAQQREAYPDVQPVMLDAPPPAAFDRALDAVREMGWTLVETDEAAGRIEATDTTFWFGFEDDVVVRVRPAAGGSRVDVRSLSRIGGGDAGANATRIRDYVAALTAE